MGLVAYTSDSDDDKNQEIAEKRGERSASGSTSRKRALPSLPGSYATGAGPNDDPSLHQGRKRSRPYVDGDHDTHIYISLEIPPPMRKQLQAVVSSTRKCLQKEIHEFTGPLHISLTHPFPLRRDQIGQVKRRLLQALSDRPRGSFHLSLAGEFRVYHNGRRFGGEGFGGRAFLALRVGAGAKEINSIIEDAIHPMLRDIHRPLYHSDPEYHASFAWWLEDSPNANLSLASSKDILASQPRGGWLVDKIHLKTGKEMTEYMI